ncbi:replication-relaxation family protein [Bacillus infantis]|uniref:replication-relaxation family protein n=1 Tax=Bacillus infantis TaxID=324767 RepID=UPI003CE9C61A
MILSNTERKRQRHESILLTLDRLGFATRSQLQRLHNLKSAKNANRILRDMAEYLQFKRMQEKIYYLSKEGRELIGSSKEQKWGQNVEHTLMRNDLFIELGQPASWKNEPMVKIQYKEGLSFKELHFRPDARFQKEKIHHFVEIDITQSMTENKKKIEKYREFYEYFKPTFGHVPVIVFYTTSTTRKARLQEYMKGMSALVYCIDDLR